jgi:hypothetical protein
LTIDTGKFYVGISQLTTDSISIAAQTESPMRTNTFWQSVPSGTGFYDLSAYSNFTRRPMIDIGFALGNDAAVTGINQYGTQYYSTGTTSFPMTGQISNVGTSSATNVNVTRTITLNGVQVYVNSQTVSSLGSSLSQAVNFVAFNTTTTGVTYKIKDSLYYSSDGNHSNDTFSVSWTPAIAKSFMIYSSDDASKDSLIAAIAQSGLTNYDVINASEYPGPLNIWRSIIYLAPSSGSWTSRQRDTLKAYLDNASPSQKRSLLIFGNRLGRMNDPGGNLSPSAEDTTFYRKYLRAKYLRNTWYVAFPNQLIKGAAYPFNVITGDSTHEFTPELITPVNGSSAAFVPQQSQGTGDSACAVSYTNSSYNLFYCTNRFSSFRYRNNNFDSPTNIFDVLQIFIYSNDGLLPVELSSFNSNVNRNDVILKWKTESETNNSGFAVERKTANSHWKELSFVKGSGTTRISKEYTYTDKELASAKYSYRLRQIDYNGNTKYFDLRNEVTVGVPSEFNLSQNYPNPFNPTTKINYDLPFDSKVSIKLFDMTGREVALIVNSSQTAGYYILQFNGSNLASGVYFYNILAEGGNASKFITTKKMVLVK